MSDIFNEVDRKLKARRKASFTNALAHFIVYGGFFVIILAMVALVTVPAQFSRHEHVVTIDSKDRVCTHGKGRTCKFMVFTTDGGAYENTDTLAWGWRWKMDSANMHAKLRVGHTYRIKTMGFRIPFFSAYENIIYADEVTNGNS